MNKNILIVYHIPSEASPLVKLLHEQMPGFIFERKTVEDEILQAIKSMNYSLAIFDLDIKLKGYTGLQLATMLVKINPLIKFLFLSANASWEYKSQLIAAIDSDRMVDIVVKRRLHLSEELKLVLEHYYRNLLRADTNLNNGLLEYYEIAKNEKNLYQKAVIFESFMMALFQAFGYKEMKERIRNHAMNEIDVIIRNEIDDSFLRSFGKYVLIECKNIPGLAISRYDLINFHSKVKHAIGLNTMGIFATTGLVSRDIYDEAMSSAAEPGKIVFLDDAEILKLIRAEDKIEEFKKMITGQIYQHR